MAAKKALDVIVAAVMASMSPESCLTCNLLRTGDFPMIFWLFFSVLNHSDHFCAQSGCFLMFQDSIVPNRSIGFETHDNTYFATVPCGVAAFDSGSDENTLFFCWIDDRRSLTVFITDSVGALFVYWGVVVFRNDLLDCFFSSCLSRTCYGFLGKSMGISQ